MQFGGLVLLERPEQQEQPAAPTDGSIKIRFFDALGQPAKVGYICIRWTARGAEEKRVRGTK